MEKEYEAPRISVLGQFPALTQSLNKVGPNDDFLTALVPQLDGSIVPD
jgi:hypothetical protein